MHIINAPSYLYIFIYVYKLCARMGRSLYTYILSEKNP